MEELSIIMARNLRTLRKKRGLSLGQLSDLSGISKVLLSNIEKGDTNPTINTIWKIAKGLKVPYTALLDNNQHMVETVTCEQALRSGQYSEDSKCRVFCYYPSDAAHNFEYFGMTLDIGADYVSPGHPEKSQEYIFVKSGIFTLCLEGRTFHLKEGDSMHFVSSVPHRYQNHGDKEVVILIMNYYEF